MINGPRHAKICLRAYAASEGPDQPSHPCSLIKVFTIRYQNHLILQNVLIESKGPDDTLHSFGSNGCAQFQRGKNPFKKFRVKWVNVFSTSAASMVTARLVYI